MLNQANLEWVGSEGEVDEGVSNLNPLKFHLNYQISYHFPSGKSFPILFLHEKVFLLEQTFSSRRCLAATAILATQAPLEKSHSELFVPK